MTWPPTCSADVAELRENEAEFATEPDATDHDPDCIDGWCGEDEFDRAVPCRVCHPTLRMPGGR